MALKDDFPGTTKYLLDPELAGAVAIARTLGMPLLLEGEPGTGKTRLAEALAVSMSTSHYEFPVTSESKVEREFAPKELDRLPGSSTLIKSDADLGWLQEIQGHGVESMLRRSTSTRGY